MKDFSDYADQVLESFAAFAEEQEGWSLTPNNFEGVHVTTPNGWILLRKSLHEPQMPLNIESDESGGTAIIDQKIRTFLSGFDGLKLSEMNDHSCMQKLSCVG